MRKSRFAIVALERFPPGQSGAEIVTSGGGAKAVINGAKAVINGAKAVTDGADDVVSVHDSFADGGQRRGAVEIRG